MQAGSLRAGSPQQQLRGLTDQDGLPRTSGQKLLEEAPADGVVDLEAAAEGAGAARPQTAAERDAMSVADCAAERLRQQQVQQAEAAAAAAEQDEAPAGAGAPATGQSTDPPSDPPKQTPQAAQLAQLREEVGDMPPPSYSR